MKKRWIFSILIGVIISIVLSVIWANRNDISNAISGLGDNITNAVSTNNRDTPSGIYKATVLGFICKATFKDNNILELYDEAFGRQIYEYKVEGSTISVRDITSNEWTLWEFKYLKDQNCVEIQNVPYYK